LSRAETTARRAAAGPRARTPSAPRQAPPALPPPSPARADSSDSDDDELDAQLTDAERERRQLQLARRRSLATVVTDVWDRAKRRREEREEEERQFELACRESLYDERWRQGFMIVDYDNSDSDE
jgi:hypothetical protein